MKRFIAALLGTLMLLTVISLFVAEQAIGQTLRSDNVPQATWWHDTGVIPMVTVENHATDFPVITAVKTWDQPFKLGTCTDPNAPCVKVYTSHWGPNGVAATTDIKTWDGPPKTIVGPVIIRLNNYYGRTHDFYFRLQTVMHELGHSVGLVHDTSGCMMPGVDGHHAFVNQIERHDLRSLYGA